MQKMIIGYVKVGVYAGLVMGRSPEMWRAMVGPEQAAAVDAATVGSAGRAVSIGNSSWHLLPAVQVEAPLD